jgi:tetraacyldisaccharide 4'-kinase
MRKLRILLLPFSWIYGIVVAFRNWLFNVGLKKSLEIPQKSICVGNLSVGGTGKTPHVDLLVNHFIKENITTATLSRGYGRSTKGLKEVLISDNADSVGDEPLFYKSKYGNNLCVVVSEKRVDGVHYIQSKYPHNRLIILDDAFQHRAVKAGLNILITDFNHRFTKDYILPAGDLRESKLGAKRADIIIISKSPKLTEKDEVLIKAEFNFDPSRIFFSHITYDELVSFNRNEKGTIENVLLVTGIGNPTPLLTHLQKQYSVTHLKFKDHHLFTPDDIRDIHEKFDTFASDNKIIVTTEKDFMRLRDFEEINNDNYKWYYQPIKTEINDRQKFNLLINNYVNEI